MWKGVCGAAALAVLACAPAAQAAEVSGVLSGSFDAELWRGTPMDGTLYIDFYGDISGVQNPILVLEKEVWRDTGDIYEVYQNLTSFLTPTGFSLVLPVHTGPICLDVCTDTFARALYFAGKAAAGPVEYRLRVADTPAPSPGAVPEPATWALMILGFGAAGSALRRRQVQTA